ncbi:glycine cleavage system protein T [Corynebacterium deserti GIMN1.010]|uniref:Glycine cleavage system protein T n=1 Tax=Corynebacterium deserti GIMN1.010 TaxID=931089 RepID=A0A0M4CKY2_9CORY|nr:folate-binding protein YgfZ [Corynebacterium deserti]ALC06701.1 glycine cleavage system protein T [Corynebacterium deserti GIMN1.010]
MANEQSEVANNTDQIPAGYRSPLLNRDGAAEAQDSAAQVGTEGVAWHYGSPLVEQRIFETGTGLVDRSNRKVISVEGPDAPAFLNNILSQKVDSADDGFSAGALDLDAQGRIQHTMQITVVDGVFYLDTTAAEFDSLLAYLTKMIFWSDVTVSEADLAIVSLIGQEIALPDAVFARRVEWNGPTLIDVAFRRENLEEGVDKLLGAGARLAGLMAYTAERVKALEPVFGVDLDDKAIPHEIPQWIGRGDHVGAVHLAKGCYRGQETVARVDNLGRSPRVIVLLHLDGSAPQDPAPGAQISSGSRVVGRLGTVVHDADYGPIAIALVKRSALGSELHIDDVAVNIDRDLLPAEENEQRGRAAINKLKGL